MNARFMSRSSLVAAPLAAAALIAAGCGGGSSSGSSSTPLTHDQMLNRANAACTTAAKRIQTLKAPTTMTSLSAYASQVGDAAGAMSAKIDKLVVTGKDRPLLNAYRVSLHTALKTLDQLKTVAAQGNTQAVSSLSGVISQEDIGVLAVRAGLSQCATAILPTA